MEERNEKVIECKACKKECKNILTHLSMKKSCKDHYGLEYNVIKEKSRKEKLAKMKKYNKENQDKIKSYKKTYKEKKPKK